MPAAVIDLATVHKQFLHLLAKAEAIRDSMRPNGPAEILELVEEIEHYVQSAEDALDAEESREALKEERVPLDEVKTRLKIT